MLEKLQNKTEAAYLLRKLVEQIITEEASVTNTLNYVRRTVEWAKHNVAVEDANNLKSAMLSPEMAKYFVGTGFKVEDGSYVETSVKNTDKQLAVVMSHAASSALVFTHSFLEYVMETILHMTRLCEIGPWLSFIDEKEIPISTVIENSVESALEAKLNAFVKNVRRESLPEKIDRLAKLMKQSITKSAVRDYTYDADRLKALDNLRHQLAHHRKKDYDVESAKEDTVFLCRTALHFLDLVRKRYDLHAAIRPTTGNKTS